MRSGVNGKYRVNIISMFRNANNIPAILLPVMCCMLAGCIETAVVPADSVPPTATGQTVTGPAPGTADPNQVSEPVEAAIARQPAEVSPPVTQETEISQESLPVPDETVAVTGPVVGPQIVPKKTTPEVDLRQLSMQRESVNVLCQQIGSKLGSVSIEDCNAQNLQFSGGYSINQRPLVTKEIVPVRQVPMDFKVLIMGGIHGDEYSSISIMFKWLELFSPMSLEGEYHWRFAPLVNPDGLLDGQAKRQNANGVDLNRNFPSEDWNNSAVSYWQESTGSNPRRYPGNGAASEPEVQWLVTQIEDFQPDVIVSVHAPYHLLDFDGPAVAPDRIGELYLHQLGVYPGSLGNYAGLNKRIPVVTLELPSAGIMPSEEQIGLMWSDLVKWLDREGRKVLRVQASTR
jgi:protein MpaA